MGWRDRKKAVISTARQFPMQRPAGWQQRQLVLGLLPDNAGVRVAIVPGSVVLTPYVDQEAPVYAYIDIAWEDWDGWLVKLAEWRATVT